MNHTNKTGEIRTRSEITVLSLPSVISLLLGICIGNIFFIYSINFIRFTSGILMDKTMADKLIIITINDTQNYPFCRLQFVVGKFRHST